jgi:hypothetical protein
MRRAGIARPAVRPGHASDHVTLVVTWMEGGEKGECITVYLRTHRSQSKEKKSKGRKKVS